MDKIQPWIKAVLEKEHVKKWTPIQEKMIPIALENKNVVGIAPTGTGKTFAFLVPLLNRLEPINKIQAMILAPTRELARQIAKVLDSFKKAAPWLKVVLLTGGVETQTQINQMKINPQIVIGTPTKMIEVFNEIKPDLTNLKTVVLDEVDMLMDLGFSSTIGTIFENYINKYDVQKMATSATLHDLLSNQLAKYFTNTEIINLVKANFAHDNLVHTVVHNKDKKHSLSVIMNQISPYLCLIFVNTKERADELFTFLQQQGRKVIKLHGGLKERERKNAYKRIMNGDFQYVVASDLASRGLDIDGASHVINYELPNEYEWYMHRAGRAGRGKYTGQVYILQSNNSDDKMLDILYKKGIKLDHAKIKNNRLEKTTYRLKGKDNRQDDETQKAIRSFIAKSANDTKPGHAKRLKEGIAKIKAKAKREHLEKVVKANRIKKYKMENAAKSHR